MSALVPSVTHTHTNAEASLGFVQNILSNFVAAVPPDENDDSTQNYSVGTVWNVPTSLQTFSLLDATPGAAQYLSTNLRFAPHNAWVVYESQPSGTAAAVMPLATWSTQVLNTIVGSASTNCTRSGNEIVLQPGTYFIRSRAQGGPPVFQDILVKNSTRLYDMTNSTVLATGSSASSSRGLQRCDSYAYVVITVDAGSSVSVVLQQYATLSNCRTGYPCGFGGEVYAQVGVWQLSD